jgi:hypothetical protein
MERVARHMARPAQPSQERECRMNCPPIVNEQAPIVHSGIGQLVFTPNFGSMAAFLKAEGVEWHDRAENQTSC